MSSATPRLLPVDLPEHPEHRADCAISRRRSGSAWGAEFLSFEDFAQQIDAARDLAELQLSGFGEPMLHPRFFDLVEYATQAGIRVSTYTRGTVLQRVSPERCVTSGLDSLRLVLDVVTSTTCGAQRGRMRRELVLRGLDVLVAARRSLSSPHPHLHVVSVVLRSNLDELPELIERAARHGAEAVLVEHLGPPAKDSAFPRAYFPTRDCVARENLLREHPERVARAFEAARLTARWLDVELQLPRLQEHRMLWQRPTGASTPRTK